METRIKIKNIELDATNFVNTVKRDEHDIIMQ